jgi:hypothetical protein
MATIPPQSTPFPNTLIDRIMPTLKDTEWRLICIFARQTYGWHEPATSTRKERDWLTQRQLMQRTGRASAAVSQAIQALIQRDLIEVVGENGDLLHTPQERQHYAGRLLFRLSPHLLAGDGQQEVEGIAGAQRSSKNEQRCLKSEVRKANTTKETENKNTPSGVTPQVLLVENETRDQLIALPESGSTKENTSRSDPDVRRFLLLYRGLFARQSPRGEMPYITWGRDGKLAQKLLKQYGYDRLAELMQAYFETEDAWVRKRGYAFTCFPALLPTLLMETCKSEDTLRRAYATPLVLHGPSDQHLKQTSDTAPPASLSTRFPVLAKKLSRLPP